MVTSCDSQTYRGAGMAQWLSICLPCRPPTKCGPGSIPGLGVKCGLSLLLVLVLPPRGFSPGTLVFPSPQKPTFSNSNSTWKQWREEPLREFHCNSHYYYYYYLLLLTCSMVKQNFTGSTHIQSVCLASCG